MAVAFSIDATSDLICACLLRDQRLLRIDLLLRDGERADFLEAFEVVLGVGEKRLVERPSWRRPDQRRLIGDRIDLGEDAAPLDVLSFLEVDAQQTAIDLGAHGSRVQRLNRADTLKVDRYVRSLGILGDDRNGSAKATPPAMPALGCAVLKTASCVT